MSLRHMGEGDLPHSPDNAMTTTASTTTSPSLSASSSSSPSFSSSSPVLPSHRSHASSAALAPTMFRAPPVSARSYHGAGGSATSRVALPAASFSTYLAARPFSPPSRLVQTLSSPRRNKIQVPAVAGGAGAGVGAGDSSVPQLQAPSSSTTSTSSSEMDSHYDKWTQHWTGKVLNLYAGMRRNAVLPVSEKTKQLLDIEHERRQAEADAQITANRVHALREQERKAAVKIARAADRLHNLHVIKSLKESRKGFRDQLKAEHAAARHVEAQERRAQELDRVQRFKDYKAKTQEMKAAMARQYHAERLMFEERRRHIHQSQVEALQAQTRLVRGEELLNRQRRRHMEAKRQAVSDHIREQRVALAEAKRQEALNTIAVMEQEERELLQRLQTRKEQHTDAYQRLALELQPSIAGTIQRRQLQQQQQLQLHHDGDGDGDGDGNGTYIGYDDGSGGAG